MVRSLLLQSLVLSALVAFSVCQNVTTGGSPDAYAAGSYVATSNATTGANGTGPSVVASTTVAPPTGGFSKPGWTEGVTSADGKCHCPPAPPASPPKSWTPAPAPPPTATYSTTQPPAIAPPVGPAPSTTNDTTSATNFLKAPVNSCLLVVAAVAGLHSLAA